MLIKHAIQAKQALAAQAALLARQIKGEAAPKAADIAAKKPGDEAQSDDLSADGLAAASAEDVTTPQSLGSAFTGEAVQVAQVTPVIVTDVAAGTTGTVATTGAGLGTLGTLGVIGGVTVVGAAAAGDNNKTDTPAPTADAAPVFTSATSANFAENASGTVATAAATPDITGAALSYRLGAGVGDNDLFNIDASTGAISFKTAPNHEAPTDAGSNNVYDLTITATEAGNALTATQALAITVTDVAETGQDTIDLGVYGVLRAPVNVDGNWYYVWDMNGDGAHNTTQDTGGRYRYDGTDVNPAGSGYQYDYVNHQVLDTLFTQDINGNANPGTDTDDTYRYATINGVRLALPTRGDANTSTGFRPGTAIDNAPAGETNLTYDDLLTIWDGHNGTTTGTNINGTPPGWANNLRYWSATRSGADDHYLVYLLNGDVDHTADRFGDRFVAVQVL